MSEFGILASAAAGMDADRAALDLAARNVAAAEASGAPGAFARMVPRFSIAPVATGDEPDGASDSDADGSTFDAGDGAFGAGNEAPPIAYLGAVAQPGREVDAVTEMVAVLDAQRAYERNASVFDVGKRLAERTIDIGRLS